MFVNKRRRVAAVAIVWTLTLIPLAAEAAAKSKHSHARPAVAASATMQSAPSTSYYNPAGNGTNIYSRPFSRGVVPDNTAGWGNVGAF